MRTCVSVLSLRDELVHSSRLWRELLLAHPFVTALSTTSSTTALSGSRRLSFTISHQLVLPLGFKHTSTRYVSTCTFDYHNLRSYEFKIFPLEAPNLHQYLLDTGHPATIWGWLNEPEHLEDAPYATLAVQEFSTLSPTTRLPHCSIALMRWTHSRSHTNTPSVSSVRSIVLGHVIGPLVSHSISSHTLKYPRSTMKSTSSDVLHG
jgi:hypothetical protein